MVDGQHINFERSMKEWGKIEGFGMRPTWLEINLLVVTLGKGKTDPRCVEYVWVMLRVREAFCWRSQLNSKQGLSLLYRKDP